MQSHIQASGSSDAPLSADELHANELSDNALAEVGLVKVSAFIRNKQSANAKRVQRAREKNAASGMRQVNVVVPTAAHETIKEIANQLQTGCDTRVVLERLLHAEVRKSDPNITFRFTNTRQFEAERRLIQKLTQLTGWGRLIAQLLRLL